MEVEVWFLCAELEVIENAGRISQEKESARKMLCARVWQGVCNGEK